MPGPPVPILVNPMDAFTFPCADKDHLFVALIKFFIVGIPFVVALEIPSAVPRVFTIGDLFEVVRSEEPDFIANGGNPADLIITGMPGGVHQPGALHFKSIGGPGPGPCGAGEPPPEDFIPISGITISEVVEIQGGQCVVVGWRVRGSIPSDIEPDDGFDILHTHVNENGNDTGEVVASLFVDGMPVADSSPPPKPPGTNTNIATKNPPLTEVKPTRGSGAPGDPLIFGTVETVFGKMINSGGEAAIEARKMYSDLVDEYNAALESRNNLGENQFEIFVQPPPQGPATIQVGVLQFEE